MFAYLQGTLQEKSPELAVIDIGGVGYRVQIPLSTYYELGEAGEVTRLRITSRIRDDVPVLYGFLTAAEQEMFQHLTGVSGVGPRIAVAVLSGMPVGEIAAALRDGDASRLQTIPGIGKRTAERLTVELRDRVRELASGRGAEPGPPPSGGGPRDDVVSALVNLGYPASQATRETDAALAAGGEPDFPTLLRETLRRLHR